MLQNAPVMISFSVDDLDKAKEFYTQSLGLAVDAMPGMVQIHIKGADQVMVYAKKSHKPATYTLLNFAVDDIRKAMDELKTKGVTFEHYDTPETKTDQDGIAHYGPMKIAFFNDPAGNNHAVYQAQ